jgi:O-antigen/teichoic acid export membrane protein
VRLADDPAPAIVRPGRRKSVLRRIVLYGAARGATEVLLGVRGLLLASVLGPQAFGAWSLFRIASRYGAFAGLGINRGLEREVSRESWAAGAGAAEAQLYGRTAIGFGLATFGTLSVAALAASFLVADPRLALGLRGFAGAIVVEQAVFYLLAYIRSTGDLRRCATLEVANSALHLALSCSLALAFGLGGAFAGFVLASATSFAVFSRGVPRRPVLSASRLRQLLRTGFPLAVALLLSTALATADSLVVAAFGGTTLLGYYSFGVAVSGLAAAVAWVIRTVVYPEVYGRAHTTGREQALRDHLRRTLLPFARLYAPLLGLLALGIAPAVALIVPRYAPAVPPARLFIFTGVPFGLATLGSVGLVAADRQASLPVFSAIALATNLTLSATSMHFGLGLEAVAAGALVSQSLYAAAVLAVVARGAGVARPARIVAGSFWPLAACVALVIALGRVIHGVGPLPAALSTLVYLAVLAPFLPALIGEVRRFHHS